MESTQDSTEAENRERGGRGDWPWRVNRRCATQVKDVSTCHVILFFLWVSAMPFFVNLIVLVSPGITSTLLCYLSRKYLQKLINSTALLTHVDLAL